MSILVASMLSVPVYAETIVGQIQDQNGHPIFDAIILVSDNGTITGNTLSDIFGHFEVEVSNNSTSLLVYADDPTSLGIDYVPAKVPIANENQITLIDGASIIVKGSVQYVNSENLPIYTYYSILDENNKVLAPMGFPLVYNTKGNLFRKIPAYTEGQLIVPADTNVRIEINSSTIIQTSEIFEVSLISETISTLSSGNVQQIELSEYTFLLNKEHVLSSLNELSSRLEEMEGYNFYLERQNVAMAESLTQFEEAESLSSLGEHSAAFEALKKSFIVSSHTIQEISNMYTEARLSTNVLIGFLALASLILGYLLVESLAAQVVVDLIIFIGSGTIFYFIYPGSRIIPLFEFVKSSAIFLLSFGLLGYYLPKFIGTKGWDERVHTRNLLEPIFSIAKRSLRRRRLRFLLTLFSLTLLVMSFVTLTSFSESYGLIVTEKSKHSDWNGVFIRDSSWVEDYPSFINFNEVEEQWLLEIPEITGISIKAENIPQKRPFISLKTAQIIGILGISEEEYPIISSSIISGFIPDSQGIMISANLAESLDLVLGDKVSFLHLDLEVQGLLDDTAFRRLKDLDGSDYVPNKWVNLSPPGEPARYFLKPCETTEVVVLSVKNAITLPSTGIQRLGLELNNITKSVEVAERLSLIRGFQSTALLPDTQVSVQLGNYYEGSGFSLAIPWIIVVLNVVVTMMNSLFERRGEIEVLSSIGLNPTQVSAIFLAEAAITGFIAGGFGYLMGLGVYKLMTLLNAGLQVNQKISAIWSIASIALSISAVLSGSYIALKSSVVITPSLMSRWKVGSQANISAPFEVTVPLKLLSSEVIPYRDYMLHRLRSHTDHPDQVTSSIKYSETENGWVITFVYKSTSNMTGNFFTSNSLYILPNGDGEHSVKLMSRGESEWAHGIGTMIRLFSMDFSTKNDNYGTS